MIELSLTKTRIQAGIWEGILTGGPQDGDVPDLQVTHLGKTLNTVAVTPDPDAPGRWQVKIAIPPELLSDGVQTFLIQNGATGETLNSFTVVTGEPLGDDIRGEMDLLRAELDMLKRAFRRHCNETM
ncbi:hypothetical protein [Psychromarinibacter sp. S121]|uniref:hypothetical protein n=1 Tax=Psychromarinibacter sp. S121 TaxID=3415127 RepID=UPI003C7E9739